MKTSKKEIYLLLLLGFYLLLSVWSFINPFNQELWYYEAGPAIIGIIILLSTYRNFKFTSTTYTWCFIAACLMTIGAHYSYSHVPLFEWVKEPLGWERNNYDKLGHIVQGIVPVLIVQELLIKKLKMNRLAWINLLSLSLSLAASAIYEIIEWISLYFNRINSNDFLGSQGFMWDAQSDMLMALLGGILTILVRRKKIKILINSSNAPLEN